MSQPITVVAGTIKPDGTLELQERLNLPAGKVQVTLVPIPELNADDPFWRGMQEIWAGQKARGHIPRGSEEVEAERRAVREQWDDRMARIVHIQEAAERMRRGDPVG